MRALKVLLLSLLGSTGFDVLACDAPAAVEFPGDGTLVEPNRLTTQVDMIRYIQDISAYVDCIKQDYEATQSADPNSPDLAALVEMNHAAIAELGTMRDLYLARVGPIEELSTLRPDSCADIRREVSPEVIDERNVLFLGQNGTAYRNVLPSECRSLRGNDQNLSFPASNVSSRAGRVNGIRQCSGFDVLINTFPSGCKWGPFFELTDEEASELRDSRR